ncbi:hypothetical protein PRNP1_004674 [Phytophthora ramorum]
MADECEAFASPGPSQAAVGGRFGSWGALVLGAALGVAGLGYVATVHHSLAAQHEIIAQMQHKCERRRREAMHAAVVAQSAMKAESETEFHQGGKFPVKFAVDFVTPLKTQDERGTCWDFATVAVLESSYRQQGVAQGWLQQDEFMAISEQAYGAEVIRLCAGPPGSPQQVACLIPGNEIWKNSTDGGDVTELMYLMNGLKDSIFPNSVCPYIPDPGNDSVCPGLTSESRTANPLSLTIKKMDTYYDACTDPNFCLVSDDYTYFVRNTTQWGDRMLRMCLFEYNTATSNSTELCLPPMLAQKIAYVLSPVAEEVRENDPDVCGFYFYPYEVQQQYKAQFGNFYVNNFEVEWHAQSYAANKALYPGLDYSEVEKSTRKQNQYEFVGPFPFARIVDKEDLPSV